MLPIVVAWKSTGTFFVAGCFANGAGTATLLLADKGAIAPRGMGPSAPRFAAGGGGPRFRGDAFATAKAPMDQPNACSPGGGAFGAADTILVSVS